ncbi:MAG TPA: hypothetical protein VER12_03950 [Polyangiaceae bacterium]|nr:hypothetical protein [Polyangiaceae bacterium]
MGATRTIKRVALAACLSLLGFGGCRTGAKRPKERKPAPVAPVPSDQVLDGSAEGARARQRSAPLPAAVVRTLSSLREHRLAIAPPTVQSQLLSFGAQRLLQASLDKATFRDSTQGQVITEAAIGEVRAVAHGTDGSLFAIGASGGALLDPRAKTVKRFPRVTFLPGSRLLPDLEGPSHFFVFYPEEPQLYWYPFAAAHDSILPFESSFALDGCREPMTQLRDGAIVCCTARGFLRQAPRGSRAEFSFAQSDDPPVRLLPAMRLDEFFAVSRAGEVLQLRLNGGLQLLARFRLPAPPYAAVSNTEALAFVLVSPPQADQTRRWSLLVTDLEGRTRFDTELPAMTPSAEEDWLAAVVEDKNLAISAFQPLVAVGGQRRLSVWDYRQGQALFTR